jgi:hypothetical protein
VNKFLYAAKWHKLERLESDLQQGTHWQVLSYLADMDRNPAIESYWTRVWIPIGATLFLVALTVSALVIRQLRLLHLLQAVIYVVVVVLARRNSAWGFGAGFAVAVAWNCLNLFVTHLMQAGAAAFWVFLRTGHVRRLDTMMVMVGGIGHFILIVACLAAFLEQRRDKRRWRKFVLGGGLALAYLALIVAIARPR